jgi:hypothetical protein
MEKGFRICWMAKMELGCLHLCRVAGERKKVEKSFRRSSRPSTAALGDAAEWEIVIDAPAEIAKKKNMQIPSTHGSHLSSLELHSGLSRCSSGAKVTFFQLPNSFCQ